MQLFCVNLYTANVENVVSS